MGSSGARHMQGTASASVASHGPCPRLGHGPCFSGHRARRRPCSAGPLRLFADTARAPMPADGVGTPRTGDEAQVTSFEDAPVIASDTVTATEDIAPVTAEETGAASTGKKYSAMAWLSASTASSATAVSATAAAASPPAPASSDAATAAALLTAGTPSSAAWGALAAAAATLVPDTDFPDTAGEARASAADTGLGGRMTTALRNLRASVMTSVVTLYDIDSQVTALWGGAVQERGHRGLG